MGAAGRCAASLCGHGPASEALAARARGGCVCNHWVSWVIAAALFKLLVAFVATKYFFQHYAAGIAPVASSDTAGILPFDDSYHASVSPFPTRIPKTRIRRDLDNKSVERGRLQLLGGLSTFVLGRTFLNTTRPAIQVIGATNNTTAKLIRAFKWRKQQPQVTLSTFKKTLQCARHEPDLDGSRGTLALAKLVPVTAQTVRIMAAYVESDMMCNPWAQCARLAAYLALKFSNSGPASKKSDPYIEDGDATVAESDRHFFVKTYKRVQHTPIDDRTRLLRVSDGALYTDWPWGGWRWRGQAIDFFALRLIGGVLELVSDVPDCVFFMRNYDYPLFHSYIPMPAFSHSPTNVHADIPFPWVRAVDDEINYYQDQLADRKKVLYKELFFSECSGVACGAVQEAAAVPSDQGQELVGKKKTAADENRRKLQASPDMLLSTTGSGITGTKVEVVHSRPMRDGERREDGERARTRRNGSSNSKSSSIGSSGSRGNGISKSFGLPIDGADSPTASAPFQGPRVNPALRNEVQSLADWRTKKSKGAFYGYLWGSRASTARMVALDLARMHPDYLDVEWTAAFLVQPYAPLSTEEEQRDSKALLGMRGSPAGGKDAGWLGNYPPLKQQRKKEPLDYLSTHKYLLVLSGNNGADRLAAFFAHSGAVILLQENDALSHFSSRLRPWVHYVPIAHSGADIVDKIKWLIEHDDMAYDIAKNGYFFGQSFLRIEDYFCHAAQSLVEVSKVETPSSKKGFAPYPAFTF